MSPADGLGQPATAWLSMSSAGLVGALNRCAYAWAGNHWGPRHGCPQPGYVLGQLPWSLGTSTVQRPLGFGTKLQRQRGQLLATPGSGSTESYSWQEQATELEVQIPMPEGTRAKQVRLNLTRDTIDLSVEGGPVILKGVLKGDVAPENSFWNMEEQDDGSKLLFLRMEKKNLKDNGRDFWKGVVRQEVQTTCNYEGAGEPDFDVNQYIQQMGGYDPDKVDKDMFSSIGDDFKGNLAQAASDIGKRSGHAEANDDDDESDMDDLPWDVVTEDSEDEDNPTLYGDLEVLDHHDTGSPVEDKDLAGFAFTDEDTAQSEPEASVE